MTVFDRDTEMNHRALRLMPPGRVWFEPTGVPMHAYELALHLQKTRGVPKTCGLHQRAGMAPQLVVNGRRAENSQVATDWLLKIANEQPEQPR